MTVPVPARASAPLPALRTDLLWVSVDLDNTLAEGIWTPENPTREIGPPIGENVAKARELHESGYKLVINTSRPWHDYETIETWLEYWKIPHRRIICGKVLAAVYVDDRARHSDAASWLPDRPELYHGDQGLAAYRAENERVRAELDRMSQARRTDLANLSAATQANASLTKENHELAEHVMKLTELVGLMDDGYSRYTMSLVQDPRVLELQRELGLSHDE
jgi:hypothetical protein